VTAHAVLTFTTDGNGHALYTERIDLSVIGRLKVERATRIEYDGNAQHWRVYVGRGRKALFHSPRRADCLAWEQAYLENREDRKHELSHGAGADTAGPRG